jgi:predicted NodU family carbamoyl transferase
MSFLFIHASHDGAITIVKNNTIIVHTQIERFNRIKHHSFPSKLLINFINNLNLNFEEVHITGIKDNHCGDQWIDILRSNNIKLYKTKVFLDINFHHDYHAYSNKLIHAPDDSYSLIWDLAGDRINENNNLKTETTSIYTNDSLPIFKEWYDSLKNNICIGRAYKEVTCALGLNRYNDFNDGKTMALSSFGQYNEKIFNKIYNKDFIADNFKDLKLTTSKEDQYSLDFVKTFQTACEIKAESIVNKIKVDNVILSGGVSQNILINTKLSKLKKIFVNPICNDQGISLGKAYKILNGNLNKIDNLYLGFKHTFNEDLFLKNFSMFKVTTKDVCKILYKEPVAIFQGRSEQGQRALGNRSLLINPTDKNAVEKINNIKKREWYRPFACSILNEKFEEYFYPNYNTVPYFMNFVYKIKENKKENLKSILSNDGYSRVQNVIPEHNINYYNLIKEFDKIYNIPILLNTSLNLPGEPIVETYEDLKEMLLNSNLKYCYLPEINIIIKK